MTVLFCYIQGHRVIIRHYNEPNRNVADESHRNECDKQPSELNKCSRTFLNKLFVRFAGSMMLIRNADSNFFQNDARVQPNYTSSYTIRHSFLSKDVITINLKFVYTLLIPPNCTIWDTCIIFITFFIIDKTYIYNCNVLPPSSCTST